MGESLDLASREVPVTACFVQLATSARNGICVESMRPATCSLWASYRRSRGSSTRSPPHPQIHFSGGGITDGIPYFLQDQRPGGFLGRAVPLRYPELGLPQRVMDWNNDHYLQYLTRRGTDSVGDLIPRG